MLKAYLVLLVLALSISKGLTLGIEEIAAKFHQNDWKLNFEWVEVVRYNKHELKYFTVVAFKYNRTTTVMNTTTEFNFDVGYDLELVAQAYKFASNEYRLFPLRIQVAQCFALLNNMAGVRSEYNCGNFTGCPIKKGIRYHICNWTPDEEHFPPYIPSGRYMVEMQALYKSTELFLVKGYASASRPIPWE